MKWKWGNDRRSERNLCNCVKKPEKNSGLQRGLNPWPPDTGATLYQLSYEGTDVGSRSIVGSYVPVKEMSVNDIWTAEMKWKWRKMIGLKQWDKTTFCSRFRKVNMTQHKFICLFVCFFHETNPLKRRNGICIVHSHALSYKKLTTNNFHVESMRGVEVDGRVF